MPVSLTKEEAELVWTALADRQGLLDKMVAQLIKKKLADAASMLVSEATMAATIQQHIRSVYNAQPAEEVIA